MSTKYCDLCGDGTHNESEHSVPFIPCANIRPQRKVLCQLPIGHRGSCQAVVFWEKGVQP